ncbi:MAG: hypothetical protein O2780_09065 [Proteobacteria bacterium]|nr:hypothetical protein [Pseudomonadota bacterium]MDA1301023.1 hypothetical protein [Pseudomonadota bacterium]
MSSIIYAIVFQGEILDGFQPISVKAHMAKLLKADAAKMQALFSGKPIVIKRTTDKTEAAKYTNALKRVGADIKVKGIKGKPRPGSTPTAAPNTTSARKGEDQAASRQAASASPANTGKAQGTPDISGISLAPNEGNLVEPSPQAAPPEIDLSGMTLAENDGTPLVAPKPREQAQIDLSEYSVADNDGSPLVEPKAAPAPAIEVPDFGLDEPGAVLETIKEDKKLLNPNTMGMTLAMAGADLLEPEERKARPPPPAPDITKIHLVPNFDP